MKKRMFSLALALVLLLALAVPALAAEEPEPTPEPEYRLTSVVSGGTAYSFSYESGGYLPTGIDSQDEGHVSIAYDEGGRITSYQDSSASVDYSYDEKGNLIAATTLYEIQAPDAPQQEHEEYTYDENGNELSHVSETLYGDGKVTRTSEYAYNEHGDPISYTGTRIGLDGSEKVETSEYEYSFDSEGRIATMTEYYDGEEWLATYSYDEDGNITEETWTDGAFTRYYPMPLLEASSDGSLDTPEDSYFSLRLVDTAGNSIHAWTLVHLRADELQLTYDDNGYLVKVDGGAGNTVELTYEPVA